MPALALTGCSSSTNGTPLVSGSGIQTPASSDSGSPAPAGSGAPTDTAGLAAFMKHGLDSFRTAHMTLDVGLAAQRITGEGTETVSAGKLTGLDLTETIPGFGALRLLQVDGKTYVQVPAKYNTSTQPWLLVTASSSNPMVKAMAATVDSLQNSASLGQLSVFTDSAKSLTVKGTEQLNGVTTTHYAVVVDVTKLPSAFTSKQDMIQAGRTDLPVDLWLDAQGRPVRVTEQFTVQGQQVSTVIAVSNYNAPVTITAPPADQVSAD